MDAATIAQLKKELVQLDQGELLEAILRLAKFKRDNKELLTYLLFLSDNESAYISTLCKDIDEQFRLTPNAHKKTVRKMIRQMDKCLRFSGNKETEIEVRLHFLRSLKNSKTKFHRSKVMVNMYLRQITKIEKAMEKLHPDLQADYGRQVEAIRSMESN